MSFDSVFDTRAALGSRAAVRASGHRIRKAKHLTQVSDFPFVERTRMRSLPHVRRVEEEIRICLPDWRALRNWRRSSERPSRSFAALRITQKKIMRNLVKPALVRGF